MPRTKIKKKSESELKVGALILARMDSTRLPKKALIKLGDRPLIDWSIDALKHLQGVTPILTTTRYKHDDPLEAKAEEKGIPCYRGLKNNIADRVIKCCEHYELDYFFRINGDSPFVNIPLLVEALNTIKKKDYDLVSNLVDRTYPYGIACELIKVDQFKALYPSFTKSQKEHITSYYYENIEKIRFKSLSRLKTDQTKLDWTIDTKEDLDRLNIFAGSCDARTINNSKIEALITTYNSALAK